MEGCPEIRAVTKHEYSYGIAVTRRVTCKESSNRKFLAPPRFTVLCYCKFIFVANVRRIEFIVCMIIDPCINRLYVYYSGTNK